MRFPPKGAARSAGGAAINSRRARFTVPGVDSITNSETGRTTRIWPKSPLQPKAINAFSCFPTSAEFRSRAFSRVGAKVIHHPIDHDTRDGDVKPDRERDSRDSPVLGKALPKGQKKRPQRERHEADGENRMGYENREKDRAHPIVSRKRLVAQRRDLNHVTDQKQDRDAEIRDHEIAVSPALPAANRHERGHEQDGAQRVQTRNCDGDPFQQRCFPRLRRMLFPNLALDAKAVIHSRATAPLGARVLYCLCYSTSRSALPV